MSDERHIAMQGDTSGIYQRGILRGVYRYAAGRPWHLRQFPLRGEPTAAMVEWPVHGIIRTVAYPGADAPLRELGVPIVNASGEWRDGAIPLVSPDDVRVGELAAAHFLARGFRHFAFACSERYEFYQARGLGFRTTIERRGFTCEALACDTAGLEAWRGPAARWIQRLPRPLAVLAADDTHGRLLCESLRDMGVRIPEEVALLGVDDDDVECNICTPPLSSVHVPWERVGTEAAALLDHLMHGRPAPREPILVSPSGVVVRRSSDALAYSDPDVVRALRYIQEHIEEPIRVTDLLAEVPLSRRSLEQRFRAQLGRSPLEEIRRQHAEYAMILLRDTDLPIPEVARRSGFRSPDGLSLALAREAGTRPLQYRQRVRTEARDAG